MRDGLLADGEKRNCLSDDPNYVSSDGNYISSDGPSDTVEVSS